MSAEADCKDSVTAAGRERDRKGKGEAEVRTQHGRLEKEPP